MSNPTKAHVLLHQRALHELRSIAVVTAYFAACFIAMMVCKRLILAEYGIHFSGISFALVSALIVAKVVLLMELVPLGEWVRRRPVIVDTLLRTVLYAVGVGVVMLLEKAFEARHEHGGFVNALNAILHTRDLHHVVATTIGAGGALLGFNVLSVLHLHLGPGRLRRLFFQTTRAQLRAEAATEAR